MAVILSANLKGMFSSVVKGVCRTIAADPTLLLRVGDPAIKAKLKGDKEKGKKTMMTTASENARNGVTNQEVCFAQVVESKGFKFLTKDTQPHTNGLFYKYEVNGSQQSGDFALMSGKDCVLFELKHGNTSSIMLNDGWFDKDVVYVISYTRGKVHCVHIALGQDIPSAIESADRCAAQKLNALVKAQLKPLNKKESSVRFFPRFANSYSCIGFREKSTSCLEQVENWLDDKISNEVSNDVAEDLSDLLASLKVAEA